MTPRRRKSRRERRRAYRLAQRPGTLLHCLRLLRTLRAVCEEARREESGT